MSDDVDSQIELGKLWIPTALLRVSAELLYESGMPAIDDRNAEGCYQLCFLISSNPNPSKLRGLSQPSAIW